MRIFRSVAYAFIALCIIICIVIFLYSCSDKKNDNPTSGSSNVVSIDGVSDNDTGNQSSKPEGSSSDVTSTENEKVIASTDTNEKKPMENTTGEISYDEIVRLQNEALDEVFRKTIAEYNKKYGITVSSNDVSSSDPVKKDPVDYKYVVNKSNGIIHRIGCILKPIDEKNAVYYELLQQAQKDGYKDKCTVCSP